MPDVAEILEKPDSLERDDDDRLALDDIDPPDWIDDGDDGEGDRDPDDDGDPVRWVVVATFWSVDQAHLARLRLESHDIPCLLDNAHLIATNWLFANAVGGVKLRVAEEDVATAGQILAARPPTEADPVDTEVHKPGCPACGSLDVYRARLSRRAFFLSLLLLGIPIPLLSNKLRCSRCGSEWRPEARGFPAQ